MQSAHEQEEAEAGVEDTIDLTNVAQIDLMTINAVEGFASMAKRLNKAGIPVSSDVITQITAHKDGSFFVTCAENAEMAKQARCLNIEGANIASVTLITLATGMIKVLMTFNRKDFAGLLDGEFEVSMRMIAKSFQEAGIRHTVAQFTEGFSPVLVEALMTSEGEFPDGNKGLFKPVLKNERTPMVGIAGSGGNAHVIISGDSAFIYNGEVFLKRASLPKDNAVFVVEEGNRQFVISFKDGSTVTYKIGEVWQRVRETHAPRLFDLQSPVVKIEGKEAVRATPQGFAPQNWV